MTSLPQVLGPINGASSGFHIVEQDLNPIRNGLSHDICVTIDQWTYLCLYVISQDSQLDEIDDYAFHFQISHCLHFSVFYNSNM